MTQYLGICMVIVVTGLVVAILARLVTGEILDEIEKIRKARFERRVKGLVEAIKEGSKYLEKYIRSAKDAAEMDRKYGAEGAKYAKEGFKEAVEDMRRDYDL